ncbi:hypothetical protein [Dyella sp.]|jgi:hypothetical protein|uniref:hypothetical protein n=1 Tax=Dyella sp. TaxID=1869338 RepID=UPI002D766179|nr:hypothetical protein [Dyella sp.]HET6431111.1 hypothetical protein [Dyella sp.]
MLNLFRFLIVLGAALVAATAVLPFDHPLNVDVPLGSAPPAWMLGLPCLLVAAVAAVPALIGLFRFRRWGRVIGLVACGAVVLGTVVLLRSPIAAAAGATFTAMLCVGTAAWCCGVCLTFHPSIAARFQA